MLFLLSFTAVIVSLSVHEFMHAFAADRLGDDTARRMGRLTLNPLAHIDPIGTVLFPLMLVFLGLPAFGWAKPVMMNPMRFRREKRDMIIASLAGPFANLVLFGLSTLAFFAFVDRLPQTNLLLVFLLTAAMINAMLAVFNILPIPPLDGSRLLYLLVREPGQNQTLMFLEKNGWILLTGYLIAGAPGIDYLFGKLIALSGLLKYYSLFQAVT